MGHVDTSARQGRSSNGQRRTRADDRHLKVVADDLVETVPVIGPTDQPEAALRAGGPRLARHLITLDDGHQVGVSVCGEGIPLVLVHGFTAEGILYAQTLARLVEMGYKVVAIDTAGHGATLGLPPGGASMTAYAELLHRVVDTLGIRKAVFMGHSMGGRLVAELAATYPERVIGVVLVDAIVGRTWDQVVWASRLNPTILVGLAAVLAVDTLTTLPLFRDPRQAAKLMKLVTPTLAGHVLRPWRMVGPAVSILRSRGSGWMLDSIRREGTPLVVVHGDRDLAVPVATGRAAAQRGRGTLVIVQGASHSWLLKDPEALPAIVAELHDGPLGEARRDALIDAGIDPDRAGVAEEEAAFLDEGSVVGALTPASRQGLGRPPRRRPRYRWTVVDSAR